MAAGSVRAGKAYIELGINSKLGAGLKLATQRIKQFGDRVSQIGKSVRAVGLRLGALGVAAGAGVGVATRIFADFDDQMRLVRAVTGATSGEFAALTEEAKRLGRTTSFTASQVAAGMVEMGRAGFDSSEILSSTEQVLALSRATATELPRATEIAGAALRGFALDSSEMQRVADVLTASVNGSAQTLEDFFEGMKYVAPVAVEAGESIEETAAAMAILANNGIKGSLAGNAITRAYKNLSTELKQTELKDLGVDAVDAAGNLRPLAEIIADIGAATANMGSARRLNIFESLFGRGQAAALKLAGGGAQFDSILEGLRKVEGTAVQVASEMDSGIGGAFRRFNSAVEGIAISIGDALAGELSKFADRLADLSGKVTKFVSDNPQFVVMIAKVAAAAIAAAAAMVAMGAILAAVGVAFKAAAVAITLATVAIKAFAVAKTILMAVASAGSVVSAVMAGLAAAKAGILALGAAILALNPITLAVAGAAAVLGVAIVALGPNTQKSLGAVGTAFQRVKADATNAWYGITEAIQAGDLGLAADVAWRTVKIISTKAMYAIANIWHGVVDDLANAFIVLESAVLGVLGRILQAAGQVVPGLQEMGDALREYADMENQRIAMVQSDAVARQVGQSRNLNSQRQEIARIQQEARDERDRRRAERERKAREAEESALSARQVQIEIPEIEIPEIEDLEIDIPSADEIAAQIPDIAAGGLQTAANLTGVTRGTFSGFAASRIGTANTYEDQSLKAQQETAQAVKSIDRKVGPTTIGI